MGVLRNTVRFIAPIAGAAIAGPWGAAAGGALSGAMSPGNKFRNITLGAASAGIGSVAGQALSNTVASAAVKTMSIPMSATTGALIPQVGRMAGAAMGMSSAQKIAEGFSPPNPPPSRLGNISFDNLKTKAVEDTAKAFAAEGIYSVSSEDIDKRMIVSNIRTRKLSDFVNIYNRSRFPTIKASQKRRW